MGMKGREIVEQAGLDADKLIDMLNKAYCDEWLAYYQYWIGAKLVEGIPRASLQPELEEHAKEELEHAGQLADRIIELGGTPEPDPKKWFERSTCGYLTPTDPSVDRLLDQNIKGERCAICVYQKILDYVRGKDMITGHIIRHILQEEVEHEQDLEDIQRDIADFRKKIIRTRFCQAPPAAGLLHFLRPRRPRLYYNERDVFPFIKGGFHVVWYCGPAPF